ncbi:hypothetical protein DFP72DRAFT_804707 [Ephemerocybe angulata]|uniref:Uncharacterized protein n=1 Tax=Ephemerocybe angulata TaxID=980116 RepID=A0A8H6IAX5_9AGAR|nr:hypothetical protein DFP72DRAFT_804707 [Tulosesus angulatus]
MDPSNGDAWANPVRGFAYSVGDPKRGFSKKTLQKNDLLITEDGTRVSCETSSETCKTFCYCRIRSGSLTVLEQQGQGIKVYWDVNAKLRHRTMVYFFALMITGCRAPPGEPTVRLGAEKESYDNWCAQLEAARRGHPPRASCDGRIILHEGRPGSKLNIFYRCQHYDHSRNRVHLNDLSPSDGLYDLNYLRALFNNDRSTLQYIEDELATFHNLGPLAPCTFTMNCSSVRTHCPFPHRDSDGKLVMAPMLRITCDVKIRVYRPIVESRPQCPRILVVSDGVHTHPIPGLSRTPPQVVDQILGLLRSMIEDIFDMTTRRFNRHPVVLAFLRNKFPDSSSPSLLDLHPSLANQDHIRNWIDQVIQECFPHGTGWKGLLLLKHRQDTSSEAISYIRYMAEVRIKGVSQRICVCMTPESSRALLDCRYIQTDIAFKRVKGYLEFELTVMDDKNPTTRILSRVFVTEESAEMHALIFGKISELVKIDTGEELKWRHLHAKTLDDFPGICLVSVDQHRGQAKGLGMHLQSVAKSLPTTPDLHEGHITIQELTDYDHLKRVLRLCTIHLSRNIEKTGTTKAIKAKMRSLVCSVNPKWDETVAEIRAEGGTKANNWVTDKEDSKFAFPAMCWEKSFIPKAIWDLGERTTNISESGHADTNREGTGCSLVGGYLRALRLDVLKEKTVEVGLMFGVNPAYERKTEEARTVRMLKRKSDTQLRICASEDRSIVDANKKLDASAGKVKRARLMHDTNGTVSSNSAYAAALKKYDLAVENSVQLTGTSSGNVHLQIPVMHEYGDHSSNTSFENV